MKKLLLLVLVCLIAHKGYTTDYNIRSLRTSTGAPYICGVGKYLTMIKPYDRTPVTGVVFLMRGHFFSYDTNIIRIADDGMMLGKRTGTTKITFYQEGTSFSCYANITVVDTTAPRMPGSSDTDICVGARLVLTSTPAANIWTSSNTAIAVVGAGASTGTVSGIADGSATITCKYSNVCGSFHGAKNIHVHAIPVSISCSSCGTVFPRVIKPGSDAYVIGRPIAGPFDTGVFSESGGHIFFLDAVDIGYEHARYISAGSNQVITYTLKSRYHCHVSASMTFNTSAHRDANGNEGENGTALAENLTGLKVSPNPGKSVITIEIPEIFETAQVIITDISGKVTGTSNTTEKTVAMDMSQYPAGNYIINVFTGDKKYSEKVVKE